MITLYWDLGLFGVWGSWSSGLDVRIVCGVDGGNFAPLQTAFRGLKALTVDRQHRRKDLLQMDKAWPQHISGQPRSLLDNF